ncbi:UDP-2,4-diacetamido-2,4,6-trideoxy-beta-L-altropyranose hydrolase [Limnohabitans sp. 15K]|uniref:UDP-2,4-diacetamido-2,4, 6-trideoxy-beta-L-altropyranose hydrolase n=1 Tax=Limnohabitans sp. 15K TaxID=1100706 RepID=UPI000C1ED17C|nr:UDP-2,4-diacetamido-2,4,6-trideoxy-beta-L-altropyranose hydrolase [Limnohabitans sp. 15K]PIT82071.1 UDP-2,4-diacetamido-2,4,6-trideoxy-beta-L-altropyranose hydrolase [Limnohabitans sp. 15K]
MNIAFRTDASLNIGTGHVMRCLALADALRDRGAQSIFICRPHSGHLLDLIQQRGYKAIPLAPAESGFSAPADPSHAKWLGTGWASDSVQTQQAIGKQLLEWLVVDHYALDRRWEKTMRLHTRRIMAIDDLADRPHDCELLLDQNLGRQAKDYDGLIRRHTQTLIGPAHTLLRPEFAQWREYSLQRRAHPQLQNLLITMGGVDQVNATGQVLDALTRCKLPLDLRITVVMGPTAPWLAQVHAQAIAMTRPTKVLVGVSNMAQLMADSDLCIGAAGGSAWERCALGLPTLILVLASNQESGAMALKSHDAAWVADDAQQLMTQMSALFNKKNQPAALRKMSQTAAKLVACNGVSQVAELLMAPHV